jgi:hypothetical protein
MLQIITCYLGYAWSFFKNESVAALIGAAAAFVLVAVNDWRRERKKAHKTIPTMLRQAREIAASHKRHAENAIPKIPTGQLDRNFAQPFASDRLQRLTEEVADHLSIDQQNALQRIVFWMGQSEADGNEALRLTRELVEGPRNRPPQQLQWSLADAYHRQAFLVGCVIDQISAYLENNLKEYEERVREENARRASTSAPPARP